MKLNRTGSNWTELELNKINENWDIIEGNHNKLEGEFNDVVGKITDEVVGHLIDSARLVWKEPVDTVGDLPANAEVGETRMVREADPDGISYVYRYDGENWEKIQAIDVTLVNEVDRRLSRQLAQIGINVANFVDDFSDTTEAIRIAEQDAYELEKPLFFPKGFEFNTTDTIEIRENIDVIMFSPIVLNSTEVKPALVIGARGVVNYAEELTINVKRKNQSNWEDEDDIGVQLINCNTTKINVEKVEGFTVGVETLGSGTGFAYCQLYLGKFFNNKIDLNLTNETFEEKMGWCNENSFFAGRCSNFNGVNEGKARYAVRITTKNKDKPFNYNNNNVFYKPSFEINQNAAGQAEALPILIEAGRYNRFYDIRDEGNSDYLARIENDSFYNYFSIGYADRNKKIADLNVILTNKIEQSRELFEKGTRLIYSSGYMMEKSNIYNNDNDSIFIPDVGIGAKGNDQVYMSRPDVKSYGDFVEILDSGLGVFLETYQIKTFTINYTTQESHHGRLYIVCFDSGGNIITGENLIKQHSIRQQTLQSNNFGGSVRINLDDDFFKTITVSDEVKKIRILFSGLENVPIRLKSFSISVVGLGDTAVTTGLEGRLQPGQSYALNQPPNGVYEVGKTIYNVSVGTNGAPLGWISRGASRIMFPLAQVSPVSSISSPPTFVGQEAIVNGKWYKSIGTSSTLDWKQITNE